MDGMLLDERNFEVPASQERVWRLIGKVIFSSLPGLERMEILDESNFRGVLRIRILGLQITLKLEGRMLDVQPPDSFSVRLLVEGPAGMFKADQRVTFTITPVEAETTNVVCRGVIDEIGFLAGLLVKGPARSFARSTFDAIEKRLNELA